MVTQGGIPQKPIPGAVPKPSGVSPSLFPRRPSQSLLSPKDASRPLFPKPGMPSGGSLLKDFGKKANVPAQVKELASLSKRLTWRGFGSKDVGWALRSHKGRIFEKYNIRGKEVDSFTKNLNKYQSVIDPREARMLEKTLGKGVFSRNIKERESSKKWLKILRDPKIFKK